MSINFESLTPNLMAQNVSKTIAYYKNILGFSLVMTMPEEGTPAWAMLKRGDATIMFQSREGIEDDIGSFGEAPIGGTGGFYIKVTGIRALFELIKDKVELVKPVKVSFYGATEFVIKDLNGYYLMFSEYE
jgi:uncharacterized glyoxalase superfamily protein PhnB